MVIGNISTDKTHRAVTRHDYVIRQMATMIWKRGCLLLIKYTFAIRPHRMLHTVVVYCYKRRTFCGLCMCMFVKLTSELCKNGCTDRGAVSWHTYVGPRIHVLDDVRIGTTWGIRLIDHWAAAMRPCQTTLYTLCLWDWEFCCPVVDGVVAEALVNVTAHLVSAEMWRKFHQLGTEMIITKSGR